MKLAYTNRSWEERLVIMKQIEACDSWLAAGHVGTGFKVAVGREKFGELCEAMKKEGFECSDLYKFPLGTDKPSEHLRHDNKGFERCCWLYATFKLAED